MAIAEEENVFIFAIHGKFRIVFHDLKIEGGKKIRTTQ